MSDAVTDPEAFYARYLETCGQIGIALVIVERVRVLVNGRNEVLRAASREHEGTRNGKPH